MKQDATTFRVNWVSAILILLAVVLLFTTIIQVFILKDSWLDDAAFNYLSGHISPARTRLFTGISFLGNHSFLIPANLLLLAYFIVTNNKWWAIRVATISLSSLAMMSLLKNLIQRHRPPMPLVDGVTNYSFPSGHAFMCVAFYGLLMLWVTETVKNKWQRNTGIFILSGLIAAIGFTRVYLRLHYATDIIGGWATGTIWLILSLIVLEKIKKGK
jgi:undecaprenyl-diphosphatase